MNGVDFKKGCYPGQEIVARLNYLGKTKRRMYRLLIDSDQLPAVNDAIASENDKEAGKILNAVINQQALTASNPWLSQPNQHRSANHQPVMP